MIREDALQDIRAEALGRRVSAYQARMATMIETLHDTLDPQMAGWTLVGGEKGTQLYGVELTPASLDELRRQSRIAYRKNPHGKNVINTHVKFTLGKGTLIDFEEKNERALGALKGWWAKVTKAVKWFSFQREFGIRALRDGEVFVRRFPNKEGPMHIRFVDPEKISSVDPKITFGIETEPDDVETVVSYRITRSVGKEETVPSEEIVHFKIEADRNEKRGRPFLESILPLFTKYDKWVDARMVLSIVRTSVALIREVQGSTTDLLRIRSAQASAKSSSSETDKAKMLRPGTIITTTPGVKYNMVSPNLEARDAAIDGRNLKLDMAAGAGLPDSLVTMDFSGQNFASSVIAQNPAIRGFEESENLFSEPFSVIIDWFLIDGLEKGEIPNLVEEEDGTVRPINLDYDIAYPPLLKRDLRQETEAWDIMHQSGIASLRTWSLAMGLDPDQERKFMEEEMELMAAMLSKPKTKAKRAPKRAEDKEPRQNVTGGEAGVEWTPPRLLK